jgi:hypothetical protein
MAPERRISCLSDVTCQNRNKTRDVENRLDLRHECLSGRMIGAGRFKKWRFLEKE